MLILSTGTRCSLAIVAIFVCAVSGQFTFTGFPTALKDSRHTVTCSYPGATSYTWRFRGGTYMYYGAAYTFTTDGAKHDGVWECDAVVNGVKKTGKINLLLYCDGVYVTGATTTNPSIGDPIELSCKVLNPSGSQVQWLLTIPGANEKGIAAVTRSRCEYYHAENDNIKFAPSTTCATSTTNHFFTLNITKVSSAHVGYWTCYDFGERGCYSKPVRIAIAKPPKDPPTLTGFNNPIVGHDHNLTCDAWQPDVRPLTYTWYKDGVQVSYGNTSTWRLQPVKRESAGRYKCEGVDKVKNLKVEAEDTLIVYYVPKWDPTVVYEAETLAVIGGSVNFTLAILVYPLPTSIELYKLKGNTVTNVKCVITKLSDTTWILTIPSVEEEDYGFYKANVTNAAGRAIFTFNLTRPHIPDAPSNLKIRVTGTYDVIVTYTSGSDGGAPQTFTIEYNVMDRHPQVIQGIEDPKNTRTVTYTIRHLLAGTTYYIKVKAVNEVGVSKFTETAKIKTSGIALTAGEIAGAVVSVILFVVLMAVVIVVVMQRRNVACCAGQADTRAPDLSLAVANSVGGDAANGTNPAFEGETEPVYVNQPQPGRAPDSVVYEDMSTPYNPYEGLNMTARAEEDQQYESLKIENTKV
ncbi:synaptogenesis protein syg-2-like isoform X2 [Lineus longissimus]|uniref:synaptogenesis protein syg-2-like isoform X2 n=1 Tax=Lineus longissimus TaxID=88925 RepID=UPI00315DE061